MRNITQQYTLVSGSCQFKSLKIRHMHSFFIKIAWGASQCPQGRPRTLENVADFIFDESISAVIFNVSDYHLYLAT
jgi:hypothetical protein